MELYPRCDGQSAEHTPSPSASFGCESSTSSPSREDSSLLNEEHDAADGGGGGSRERGGQMQALQQTLSNAANAVSVQVDCTLMAAAEPVKKVIENLKREVQCAHSRRRKCTQSASTDDADDDKDDDRGHKQKQKQKRARGRELCACLQRPVQCWTMCVFLLAALATGALLATGLYVPLLVKMRLELEAQHEDRLPEMLVRIDELRLDLRHMQRLVQHHTGSGALGARVNGSGSRFDMYPFADSVNYTAIDVAINDPTDANARFAYDALAPLRDSSCCERSAAFQIRLAAAQYLMGHVEGERSDPIRRRYFLNANATLTRALVYDTHKNNSLLFRWYANTGFSHAVLLQYTVVYCVLSTIHYFRLVGSR